MSHFTHRIFYMTERLHGGSLEAETASGERDHAQENPGVPTEVSPHGGSLVNPSVDVAPAGTTRSRKHARSMQKITTLSHKSPVQ